MSSLDELFYDDTPQPNLEVLNSKWFNRLGIIKAKDTITGEIKIYIGEGFGFDKKQDINHILNWGTKYTLDSFKELVDWLGGRND